MQRRLAAILAADVVGYSRLMAIDETNVVDSLKALRRDLATVGENEPLLVVFDRLVEDREHIALVVDKYGGTSGIATMEDVIETLLGLEITDETDKNEDMQLLGGVNIP